MQFGQIIEARETPAFRPGWDPAGQRGGVQTPSRPSLTRAFKPGLIQDVDTNYETDLFQSIIQHTKRLARSLGILPGNASAPSQTKTGSAPTEVSYRVIADHARATVFLMSDGVMPSNEGRGYVLRRIMRRAIRHGKKLGFDQPFLFQCAEFVIDEMKGAYPDLVDKKAFLSKAVQAEEEQFFRILERGLSLLDEEVGQISAQDSNQRTTLRGEVAFKLYDTYGFPLDLTRVICAEKGILVDEVGFEKYMDRQRSESRKHWKGSGQEAVDSVYLDLASSLNGKPRTRLEFGVFFWN